MTDSLRDAHPEWETHEALRFRLVQAHEVIQRNQKLIAHQDNEIRQLREQLGESTTRRFDPPTSSSDRR